MLKRITRAFAWLCVLALVASTLPLYAIAFYNHPYYDDYGFSAGVRQVWRQTGSLGAVCSAAVKQAAYTRQTWQGTYLGTFLTNLQPGLFSEDLYWIGSFFLLTALIVCLCVYFTTVFGALGLARWARVSLTCLATTVAIQFLPDVGEAFYWFNGGVGNTFVYSLLALFAALTVRLLRTPGKGVGLTLALNVLAALLGGGSYGGGLFGLCVCAVVLAWLFWSGHAKRWSLAAAFAVFLAGFLYSVSAPGNAVRAGMIGYSVSPLKAVAQSLLSGVGLLGGYVRLPIVAVALALSPALYEAARQSHYRFAHPWRVTLLGAALYCAQLTPPLYSIASIGDGRIENTYFLCFVMLWFPWVYYLLGVLARRLERAPALTPRRFGALLMASACLFAGGCLAFRRPGDTLYGAQNLSGASAALSLLTGEAARYDAQMKAREALLNDDTQPVVTLAPLDVVPAVFMEDLLAPGAADDVRPVLCEYYGKQAIRLEGEVDAP